MLLLISCAYGCDSAFGIRSTVLVEPIDATQAIDAAPHASCGTSSSNARDEDGDGVANDIDDCPGIYDLQQHDTDGDGVGDLCDPHPVVPIDRFVDTTYFDDNLGCWIPDQIANWSVANGSVTTPVTGPATMSLEYTSLAHPTSKPTVEIQFSLVGEDPSQPTNSSYGVQIVLAYPNSQANCFAGAYHAAIASYIAAGGQTTNIGTDLHMGTHRLTFSRDGSNLVCVLDESVSSMATDSGTIGPVNVTLQTGGGAVKIDYVMFYGSD